MSERNSRETFRDKRAAETEQGSDDGYSPEDVYFPWKKGNVEGFTSNLGKSSGLLLIIVGAGVFILVALFVFLPMLRSPTDAKSITEMEARVKKMEAKLTEMEENYQKVAQLALQQDKIDQVSARLDKLGASTTQRLDLMNREIETFHKQSVPIKTDSTSKQPAAQVKTEPASKQPSAPKKESVSPSKPAETPEKKSSTEKYHEVKPKETLYGIGKTYGLTVDELRRLNNMGPTETARTGQKLKVSK